MNNYTNPNVLLQTYYSLPSKFQEDALIFMQFLLSKFKLETEIEHTNKSTEKKKRKFGYFPQGTFIMSEDFDAPLDCFKEYMK